MITKIIDFFKEIMGVLLSILPNSPFTPFLEKMADIPFLGYVNYFIPMQEIIAISSAWLLAITGFYIVQLVLRWVKAIE